MGLNSINYYYLFSEETDSMDLFNSSEFCVKMEGRKTFEIRESKVIIEIELLSNQSISIRVPLCNPTIGIIDGLIDVFTFLFKHSMGKVKDLQTDLLYSAIDGYMIENLEKGILDKKSKFRERYGDVSLVMSSKEFDKFKHTLL
jgi:hypothetical protein